MLGLLVNKPEHTTVRRARVGSAIESVVEILKREQRPLSPRELHTSLAELPGFSEYKLTAVYALLNVQKKKNGEALVRQVGRGQYDLVAQT